MDPATATALLEPVVSAEGFSGVVSVSTGEDVVFEAASGLAHRALGVPNTPSTRFAVASGSKGFTALAVARLIEEGVLALDTPVRRHLGGDLPLIDDAVTVEHLLGHTSGIGDYLDEDELDVADHVLGRPIHTYVDAESFLPDLDGHPQVSAPGETFAYNNGGYLVLALVAARASGRDFHELVRTEVLTRAGLHRTDFLASDRLPGDVALGYLEDTGDRTNVHHLPLLGGGDGGAYTDVADMRRFWRALVAGEIVSGPMLETMAAPRHLDEGEDMRYGLGFWRYPSGPALVLEGCDAGVSFHSAHDPGSGLTATVLANTAGGAWPAVAVFREMFAGT